MTTPAIKNSNFKNLRKLYGRTATGNRTNMKITLQPETIQLMNNEVQVGKGKSGSALLELAVRTLIVLVNNGEDVEHIAIELSSATSSPYLPGNLRMLAKYLEA